MPYWKKRGSILKNLSYNDMKGWGKYGKWNTRKVRNIWRGMSKAISAVQVSSFLNTRGEHEAGLGAKCSIS